MKSSEIRKNIEELRKEIPSGVELVAVSKFHPEEAILAAYEEGQRRFGESRVQELSKKVATLPKDIEWHFIGHLQTNKVKMLTGCRPALIESVDSEHLLDAIDKESEKAGIVSRVLMQLHVAQEETKFGFTPEELIEYFREKRYEKLKATHICGVMGMASNTEDRARVREDFRRIADTFRQIREENPDLRGFDEISMGMSGDWPAAVEEGATLIRIGTRIFGEREYK
ncbi:MAG: YggS family pyridoxal phosphate-dependent enzyme [Muribaculaceae bacterium]|nr:YggS family pyridoxal phosphate-dependent enzyme [Muribaculaceae bacterium]